VLVNWKPELILYNLNSKESLRCDFAGHIFSAVASKNFQRIAVEGEAGTCLVDAAGKVVAWLGEQRSRTERPALLWFDRARCLLRIGREDQADAPVIESFEAVSGELSGRLRLDPNVLLPYPASEYASIQRNAYSLILSHSTRLVGHYIDIWTRVLCDDSRSILQLQTYRPTSEPFAEGGKIVCTVEPRWIEVELLP
jgi:hypothetical protein